MHICILKATVGLLGWDLFKTQFHNDLSSYPLDGEQLNMADKQGVTLREITRLLGE